MSHDDSSPSRRPFRSAATPSIGTESFRSGSSTGPWARRLPRPPRSNRALVTGLELARAGEARPRIDPPAGDNHGYQTFGVREDEARLDVVEARRCPRARLSFQPRLRTPLDPVAGSATHLTPALCPGTLDRPRSSGDQSLPAARAQPPLCSLVRSVRRRRTRRARSPDRARRSDRSGSTVRTRLPRRVVDSLSAAFEGSMTSLKSRGRN